MRTGHWPRRESTIEQTQNTHYVEEGRSAPLPGPGTTSGWARAAAAVSLGFVMALSAVAVTDSVRDGGAAAPSTLPPAGVSSAAGGAAPGGEEASPEAVEVRGCWFTCWRR